MYARGRSFLIELIVELSHGDNKKTPRSFHHFIVRAYRTSEFFLNARRNHFSKRVEIDFRGDFKLFQTIW